MTTYLWTGNQARLDRLKPEEGFTLRWGTREELCNPYSSPFAYYNKFVFEAYDTYMGV